MTIELLLSLFGAVAALSAGAWAMLKVLGAQFEKHNSERFSAVEKIFQETYQRLQEQFSERLLAFDKARSDANDALMTRIEKLEERYEKLDTEVRAILIDMPREFVARTDYVRRESVLEGKIDLVSLRIENWMLKGQNDRRDQAPR